jgi:hypothetical protein
VLDLRYIRLVSPPGDNFPFAYNKFIGTYIFQRPDSATEELKVWEA